MNELQEELKKITSEKSKLLSKGFSGINKPRTAVTNGLVLDSELEEYKKLEKRENELQKEINEMKISKTDELKDSYITSETTALKTRQEELIQLAKNANTETPMKVYYDDHVREVDYEEFVLISKMLDMLTHSRELLNTELYFSYKNEIKNARKKSDLKQIKSGLDTIKQKQRSSNKNSKIIIVDGNPILEKDKNFYKDLKKLEYLIESNLEKEHINEYKLLVSNLKSKTMKSQQTYVLQPSQNQVNQEEVYLTTEKNLKDNTTLKAEKSLSNQTSQKEPNEELAEIVNSYSFEIPGNNKTTLISLGLTAVSLSVASLWSNLISYLVKASKASEIITLTNAIITNNKQSEKEDSANQQVLQDSNITLAKTISTIIGIPYEYVTTTKQWNFAGENIYNLAEKAHEDLSNAIKKSSSISTLATTNSMTLLGTFNSYYDLPQEEKSEEYKNFKRQMRELLKTSRNLNAEQVFRRNDQIRSQIEQSTKLTEKEKEILYKMLNKYRNKSLSRANSNDFIGEYNKQKTELETSPLRIHI